MPAIDIDEVYWLVEENDLDLGILASLESGIEHPIAKALARLGRCETISQREVGIASVAGLYDGRRYLAGQLSLFAELELSDHLPL